MTTKDQRLVYPWAEICEKCGTRLRDGNKWLVEPVGDHHEELVRNEDRSSVKRADGS